MAHSDFKLIKKGDPLLDEFSSDAMMQASPDFAVVAKDDFQVRKAMALANEKNIPITFAASQTSMTGASVANEGMIIGTKDISGIIDISRWQGWPVMVVKPGTLASDIQAAADSAGFYFPAVPTSKDESRIGGNVNTNASGEGSFKYGAVRRYVRRLKVRLISGEEKVFERGSGEEGSGSLGRAGYFENWKNEIDLFIGSEGTLGYLSEITLELLPRSQPVAVVLLPFSNNEKGVRALVQIAQKPPEQLRALEFVDESAHELSKKADAFLSAPANVKAWVYLKFEVSQLEDADRFFKQFAERFCPDLKRHAVLAKSRPEIERLHDFRKSIPDQVKVMKEVLEKSGGGKAGGDWWVPIANLEQMLSFFYEGASNLGCFHMAYAHLGQGHPHTNILAQSPSSLALAREFQRECAKRAVKLGGGARGEHGVGKIYRDLIGVQHSKDVIAKFYDWKLRYDPNWLLGRGNILSLPKQPIKSNSCGDF